MRRAERSLPRQAGPEEPFRSLVPDPLERVSPQKLRDAARRALTPRPEEVVHTDHIAPIRASVADAISLLLDRVPERGSISFRELAADAESRLEMIVRFLAVLELFKQGFVELEQLENFGVLEVRRASDDRTMLDAASIADWDEASETAMTGEREQP
jgi:segregation and condensation protein A